MIKRLVALMLAVTVTMSCIPCGFAEEVAPVAVAPAATPAGPAKPEVTGGDIAAAAITDVVYVPAKVGMCAVSGVAWALIMTLSGCTAYKTARDLIRSGCTGKWVLTGEDFVGPGEAL